MAEGDLIGSFLYPSSSLIDILYFFHKRSELIEAVEEIPLFLLNISKLVSSPIKYKTVNFFFFLPS